MLVHMQKKLVSLILVCLQKTQHWIVVGEDCLIAYVDMEQAKLYLMGDFLDWQGRGHNYEDKNEQSCSF
jgi:hypothetical protein